MWWYQPGGLLDFALALQGPPTCFLPLFFLHFINNHAKINSYYYHSSFLILSSMTTILLLLALYSPSSNTRYLPKNPVHPKTVAVIPETDEWPPGPNSLIPLSTKLV